MNYYDNAVAWERAATNSLKSGDYRASVFACCLAVELYLKSQLVVADSNSEYENSHDVDSLMYCEFY